MKKIAVFGSGGFGREVKMLIDQINDVNPEWEFLGYFDDNQEKGALINGASILGGINELNQYSESILHIVLAVGDPKAKKSILSKLGNTYIKFARLVHPSVYIGKDNVVIGEGVIICAGVVVTVNVSIEDHVILNLSCTVGHDTNIGRYSSFMPAVNISGEVMIREGVYVGTGVKIINQLTIGEWTTVGAGAVVAKSLPAKCTAIGIPAKPMKFHE